jgi:hypothetical protein
LRKPGLELETLGYDTILGIDKLYFIGAKGHIYIHVQVCKYAGNPLTGGETIIYKYTSNIVHVIRVNVD